MADDEKMDVDQKKISDNDSKDMDVENDNDKKINSPTKESNDPPETESKDTAKDETESKKKEENDTKTEDTDSKSVKNKETTNDRKSTVDREKVCPFLLRVFCKRGSHHRLEDFTINHQPVEDEIQIYTWKDASLREIASLLAEIDPKYAKHGNSISFKAVYLDNIRARYNSKDLGVINVSKPSKTDNVTLEENKFIIGDFIDVALQSYSDARRSRYSYDRSDTFNGRLGGSGGRFSSNRGGGLSFDRNRKGRIGERHDRFSSRRSFL